MQTFDEWVGRAETVSDMATAAPAHLMAATLDRDRLLFATGDELPPVWHWLYFLNAVRTRDLGADGHPPKGGFLPPIDLPRRMRAGGEFRFHRPIRIGDSLERRSRIVDVTPKTGSSGSLVFVRIQHEIFAKGELAVVEGEDLVYREAGAPVKAAATPRDGAQPQASSAAAAVTSSRFPTSSVLLFRVSALTFNGHRIHYDNDYAQQEEGYPDRLVHGPLLALMMLEHLDKASSASSLKQFQYRAMAPAFCGETVTVSDEPSAMGTAAGPEERRVVARNGAGAVAVVGQAVYG